jgi:hypothetical protein
MGNIRDDVYTPSASQVAEDAIKISEYTLRIISETIDNNIDDVTKGIGLNGRISDQAKQMSDDVKKIHNRLVPYYTTLAEHSLLIAERKLRKSERLTYHVKNLNKRLLILLEGFLIYAFIDRYSKHFYPMKEFLRDFSFIFSISALVLFLPLVLDVWPKKKETQ